MGSTAVERPESGWMRFVLSRWGKYLSWIVLAVAGGLGGWAIKWWFEDNSLWVQQLGWLLGALALGGFGVWRDQVADERKQLREDALEARLAKTDTNARVETYRHVLDPFGALHQAVGDLLTERDYQTGLRQFRIAVVTCIAQLMPEDGHRACFYAVDEMDGKDQDSPGGGATDLDEQGVLVLATFRGRVDEPRHSFTGNNADGKNPHGQRFLKTAFSHGGPECFSTIDPSDETVRPSPNSVYKSFMVVPVRKGSRSFGALSIDCQTQVEYDDRHRKIASSLALLLAIAEDRATRRSRSRGADAALSTAFEQILRERRQAAGPSYGVGPRNVDPHDVL